MDGTLIDSTGMVDVMWRELCERSGIDADFVLANIHGVPARDIIAAHWPESAREAAFAWIEEAESERADGIIPIPGARELVTTLTERGARWAIVTSATRRQADARLRAAGFPLPEVLVTVDDVAQGKPHPEPYLQAAHRLGVDPARCIVLEDAGAGIRSGVAAGAQVVVRGTQGGPEAATHLVIDDYLGTVIDGVAPIRGRWR